MKPPSDRLWQIRILSRAYRKLQLGPPDGLPASAAFAALELINGPLRRHPKRVGKPLHGEFTGKHVARRGDYRIIYLIDEDKHLVTVFDVGSRGHIYYHR